MYAIIESCGKQYKVAEGDVVFFEKLDAEEGKKVSFDKVVLVSDDKKVVGGTETGKTENDKNTSKLPNTGAPISSVQVVLAAMIVMAIGAGMLRNEKSKVE